METWVRTVEPCPACGAAGSVAWDGRSTPSPGGLPLVLSARSSTCPNACYVDPDQLWTAFPDRPDVPG